MKNKLRWLRVVRYVQTWDDSTDGRRFERYVEKTMLQQHDGKRWVNVPTVEEEQGASPQPEEAK